MRRFLWICLLFAALIGGSNAFVHGSLRSVHSSHLRLLKLSAARKTRFSDPEVQERQRCEAVCVYICCRLKALKCLLVTRLRMLRGVTLWCRSCSNPSASSTRRSRRI